MSLRRSFLAVSAVPIVFAVFAMLTGACSKSEGDVASGTDAGLEGAAPDSGTTEGGGSVLESGVDAASLPEASSVVNVGSIFAISDGRPFDGGVKASSRAGAYFVRRESSASVNASKPVGPCLVEIFGSMAAPFETALSAGTVSITGGLRTVELVPKANKTYATVEDTNQGLWNGGESLTFAAAGSGDGGVPAFSTSLIAPSRITLTSPAPSGGVLNVAKSGGVRATWTGTSSGEVTLYFDAAKTSEAVSATCTFDAALGAGDVPAAAFADFPTGEGTFDFFVKKVASATAGSVEVKVTTSSALVLDTDGASEFAFGRAKFQ